MWLYTKQLFTYNKNNKDCSTQLFIKYIASNFFLFNYKDYTFRGFSPCPDPFLECFVSPLHQGEEQPDIVTK